MYYLLGILVIGQKYCHWHRLGKNTHPHKET